MSPERAPRGRVTPQQPSVRAPNAEPMFGPEPPKKLEFGKHIVCPTCHGKGKKRGNKCGTCNGFGVIDDPTPGHHDHP